MADGTNVGSIFLDLIVRDTIEQQVQALTAKAKAKMQSSMSGIGEAMSEPMAQAGKTAQAAFTAAAEKTGASVSKAKGKLADYRKELAEIQSSTDEMLRHANTTEQVNNTLAVEQVQVDALNKKYAAQLVSVEKISAKMEEQQQKAASMAEIAPKATAAQEAAAQRLSAAREASMQRMEAVSQKAESAISGIGEAIEASVDAPWSRSVEMARIKASELQAEFERIKRTYEEALNAPDGEYSGAALMSMADHAEQAYNRMAAARERLVVEMDAAAEKEAADAEKASEQQKRAAAKAAEATKRHWRAAGRAVTSVFRGLGKAGTKAFSSITSRVKTADKTATQFGSRLRQIASGALLFNGISTGIRKLTQYFGSAIGKTDQMQKAMANLKGAAATAAAPVIQILTPALSALANVAATVFSYISKLISLLTGKSVSAMSSAAKGFDSTGKAAGGAAKNIKKASASLAGFDEIQKLDSKPDDAGGGSGTGAPELNYDFSGKSPFLDSVLGAVKAGDWSQVGSLVSQKLNDSMAKINWPNIRDKASTWTSRLLSTLNGFVGGLDWNAAGNTIGNGLNVALSTGASFIQTFDWSGFGSGIGTGLSGAFGTLDWASLGVILTGGLAALFGGLHGFVQTFDFSALGSDIAAMLVAAFNNVDWVQAASDLGKAATGMLQTCIGVVNGIDWSEVGKTIYDCLVAIDWGQLLSDCVEFTAGLAAGLISGAGSLLSEAFSDLGETISGYFSGVGENGIDGFFQGMGDMMCDYRDWWVEHVVDPVVNGVKNALGIHSPSTVFSDIGRNLILGLLEGVTAIWGRITSFFSGAFSKLWDGVREITDKLFGEGLKKAVVGGVNGIISAINGMISGVVSGLNSMISALNKLKFTVPDWIPAIGGKSFGFNLKAVTAPQIPMLANGGVIRQPTLAMMGEYAGARGNPEIAAPQSTIQEIMNSAMSDMVAGNLAGFEAVVAVLREILEAVLGIHLGDSDVADMLNRHNQKRNIMNGGAL